MTIDEHRLAFMKGVIATSASNGQLITYSQIRRLCRLSMEQVGAYLGEARRRVLLAGQPDFCAIVVGDDGTPGQGWFDPHVGATSRSWAAEVQRVHAFWRDRRCFDNTAFEAAYGELPAEPGLNGSAHE